MVFALETYWPAKDGWSAARIEEEVVVTADGCEVITKFPAEDLLVCGTRYWTIGGALPTLRDTPVPPEHAERSRRVGMNAVACGRTPYGEHAAGTPGPCRPEHATTPTIDRGLGWRCTASSTRSGSSRSGLRPVPAGPRQGHDAISRSAGGDRRWLRRRRCGPTTTRSRPTAATPTRSPAECRPSRHRRAARAGDGPAGRQGRLDAPHERRARR